MALGILVRGRDLLDPSVADLVTEPEAGRAAGHAVQLDLVGQPGREPRGVGEGRPGLLGAHGQLEFALHEISHQESLHSMRN